MSVPFSALGITLDAQLIDEIGRGLLRRARLGDRVEVRRRPGLVDLDWRDRRHSRGLRDVLFERLQPRIGGARVAGRIRRTRATDSSHSTSSPFDDAFAGEPSETARISGPLTPAPKFCEIWSYARRAVVEVESAAVSFCPRFSDSSGIASGIRITRATSPAISGWLAISSRPPRPQSSLWDAVLGSRSRTRNELMCAPVIASIAGSNVSAASTATTTAIAAMSPMVVTSGMLGHGERRQCDCHRCAGEKHRAAGGRRRPRDRLIARSSPCFRPRKCRVTMKSA